jgi:hypothetical protein
MVASWYGSRQLLQPGPAGQQAGKALIHSKSDDHENVNIFYKKNWQVFRLAVYYGCEQAYQSP